MSYSPRKRLEENVIAGFARVTQIYGIPASHGRLYAVLYLADGPMSLAELSDAIGAAKSTTSVALRRLERARLVRRQPRGSDRRDYYQAVTDPMQVLQDAVRHFLLPELQVGADMVGQLEHDLKEAEWAGEYEPEHLEKMKTRLAELQGSLAGGQALVRLLEDEAAMHAVLATLASGPPAESSREEAE